MEKTNTSSTRWVDNFDWSFLGLILVLCLLGLMTLFSSVYVNSIEIFYKQFIFFGIGLAVALILTILDYRIFERLAWPIYFVVVALLVAVDIMGIIALGAQRWLKLGPVNLQPSELAKFAIILILARYFSKDRAAGPQGYGFRELMPVFVIVGIPMILTFLQPDLGTAGMIGFVAASVIFYCQIRWRTLISIALMFFITAPIAYNFLLHDYQRDRVKTFLDPSRDPLGEGYHSIQSMIAVGSGQLFGKGYLEGSQSKLEFLPKHHTDFIFSAFAEEWGFLGAMIVLILYVVLIFMGVDIARKSKDKFGSILAIGAVSLIAWHVIINIGMEIGLLPVVGVPLPFFSYGGSAMVTNMLAVGLLLSVSFRRYIF